eukprot:COSAG02_NODE_2984_length_7618_cov_6.217981_3_plen_175_part_00
MMFNYPLSTAPPPSPTGATTQHGATAQPHWRHRPAPIGATAQRRLAPPPSADWRHRGGLWRRLWRFPLIRAETATNGPGSIPLVYRGRVQGPGAICLRENKKQLLTKQISYENARCACHTPDAGSMEEMSDKISIRGTHCGAKRGTTIPTYLVRNRYKEPEQEHCSTNNAKHEC